MTRLDALLEELAELRDRGIEVFAMADPGGAERARRRRERRACGIRVYGVELAADTLAQAVDAGLISAAASDEQVAFALATIIELAVERAIEDLERHA